MSESDDRSGEFEPIWGDIRSNFSALLKIARTLCGVAFMGAWWGYTKFKFFFLPKLPLLFVVASVADFTMLVAAGFLEIDRRIHDGDPIWHPTGVHAAIHGLGRAWALGAKPLIAFSVISLALSLLMFWHHHRMTEKVRGHLLLLGSLRQLSAEATRLVISAAEPSTSDAFIEDALLTLTEATTKLKGGKIKLLGTGSGRIHGLNRVATVLRTEPRTDTFGIEHQWLPNTYDSLPDNSLSMLSAAGKALQPPKGAGPQQREKGVIYIPWTRVPHGLRHWTEKTKTHFEYIRDAFADIGQPKPKSLICTEIPVEMESEGSYVLCMDSNKWMCFEEVDFQALLLIACMVGIVLTEQHRVIELHRLTGRIDL
jgi:hypothetical protein